ncbi:MAG TPA: inositol monophosphatase family protein [Acidimicrobiales bacterium]
MPTPAELLAVARPLAEEAGRQLLEALAGERTISTKTTGTDLVTEMDAWAEEFVTAGLLAARPDDSVRGEEGADHRGTSDVTWWVDPIDGTVNYVHGLPGFNVSIAADVDGETMAGVVVSPLHHDVFWAGRGMGAFRNDERISASATTEVSKAVVGTGFSYESERRRRQAEIVAAVIGDIADIRRDGAAAIDLCWVACGRLDAFWETGLNRWDHAAGVLIASEAGAICTDLDGGPVSQAFALAAPPALHPGLQALLREHAADQV